jgi:hypothetical protein
LGVSSYGMSWTVTALWSTSTPVTCAHAPDGATLVMTPSATVNRRHSIASVDRRTLPEGSVTWK